MPFRIIPNAMQRKANRRPRWVSGHISPYPTVEMLTYGQINIQLISWEETYNSGIRDNFTVSVFRLHIINLKYSLLTFILYYPFYAKIPSINNNSSQAIKKDNSAVWHDSAGFSKALSGRRNFQTISTPACSVSGFSWLWWADERDGLLTMQIQW